MTTLMQLLFLVVLYCAAISYSRSDGKNVGERNAPPLITLARIVRIAGAFVFRTVHVIVRNVALVAAWSLRILLLRARRIALIRAILLVVGHGNLLQWFAFPERFHAGNAEMKL